MPLLVCFGRELGNKHAIQLFQHNRIEDDWVWKDENNTTEYFCQKPKNPIQNLMFLKIAISDSIGEDKLKSLPDINSNIYEIGIENPTLIFLFTEI